MYKTLADKDIQLPNEPNPFNGIWTLPIQPKIKNFLWILQLNKLPTRQYLNYIGISQVATWTFYQNAPEIATHIFITWTNAKLYCLTIGISSSVHHFLTMNSPNLWLHNLIHFKGLQLPHKPNTRTFLSLSLWHIWVTHNRNIFDQKS